MAKNQSLAALLVCLIMLSSMTQVKAGPLTCAGCLAAAGGFATGGFASAGTCFSLLWPPAVCGCLGGLGIILSSAAFYTCFVS